MSLFKNRKRKSSKVIDITDLNWLNYDTGRDDAASGNIDIRYGNLNKSYAAGVSDYLRDKSNDDIPEDIFWQEYDATFGEGYRVTEIVSCENCGHNIEFTFWIEDEDEFE